MTPPLREPAHWVRTFRTKGYGQESRHHDPSLAGEHISCAAGPQQATESGQTSILKSNWYSAFHYRMLVVIQETEG